MESSSEFRIVLVTCASGAEGRKIAKSVVGKKLAACVNILPGPVESVYRWKGSIEKSRERLLLIKTSTKRLKQLEEEVSRLHSYETPEFLVVTVAGGSQPYLSWLKNSLD